MGSYGTAGPSARGRRCWNPPASPSSSCRKEISFKACVIDTEVAKVSIVGIGMRSHAGIAKKMFESLANENINILVISTSEIKISILVEQKYMELAVQILHDAFELDKV